MKRYVLPFFAAVLSMVVSGCLLTGQINIVQDIDIGVTTSQNISKVLLDLNANEDYADNKDKIKSVDAISFVAKIFNRADSATSALLYISSQGNFAHADTIKAKAIKVMSSPAVPPGDSLLIHWADGYRYMHNLDSLVHYVKDVGQFYVYAIAEPVPFDDSIKAQIVITLTVGK